MQATPTKERVLRRTFLGLPIILWVLLAAAGVAVAIIGFVVRVPITGELSTGDGINITFLSGSTTAEVNSRTGNPAVGTCYTNVNPGSESLEVQATGMLATEDCYFTVVVENAGPADAVLQRYNLQPNDSNGIRATVGNTTYGDFCGTPIPAGGSAVIGFQIDFGEDAVPGFGHLMTDPIVDNLKFVRVDIYNPGDCF